MRTAAILICAIAGAMAAFGQAQRIEHYELRPAADMPRLYIKIDGEDRLISTRGMKAWPGWTPQTLIYAERAPTGTANRLRWYDAFTRNSYTISNDELNYEDVATARLSNGKYAILVALRDPQSRIPYVELATPEGGVFLREQFATYGTATNDTVQIRRFTPEDVQRHRGDFALLSPSIVGTVSLLPKPPDAAGLYETSLPAVGDSTDRKATLNLRAGGQATLIVTAEGKSPIAQKGTWKQQGAEVRVELESGPFVWVVGANGLTPKLWNRQEWGSYGVPLRRTGGQ